MRNAKLQNFNSMLLNTVVRSFFKEVSKSSKSVGNTSLNLVFSGVYQSRKNNRVIFLLESGFHIIRDLSYAVNGSKSDFAMLIFQKFQNKVDNWFHI